MATLFYDLERYAESANFNVKALEVCFTKLGREHPNIRNVFSSLINILRKVIEYNQIHQLSAHSLIQDILKKLQSL